MSIEEQIWQAWPFKENPPRRVVVKVGSNVLALPHGGLSHTQMTRLVTGITTMLNKGIEVILVSSGAVAAGRGVLGLEKRPASIPELQAVAAIGQGVLMEQYSGLFRRYGLIVAQLLLNRDDMDDRRRYLNARYALTELIGRGVVPIINENDSVTIEELKFGDNDMLSAMIAAKMDADLLLILSNIPGLMTGHPTRDPNAILIPIVEKIGEEHECLVVKNEGSTLGTGGMETKLMAARHATNFGVTCAMVDGMKDGKIERVMSGKFEGTLFLPTATRRSGSSRRHWLSSVRPKGEIIVDKGAEKALLHDGKSLLAVGITDAHGEFTRGDVISITSQDGAEFAHGVVNFDIAEVLQMKGLKGPALAAHLGESGYIEIVHRNNMVLLK